MVSFQKQFLHNWHNLFLHFFKNFGLLSNVVVLTILYYITLYITLYALVVVVGGGTWQKKQDKKSNKKQKYDMTWHDSWPLGLLGRCCPPVSCTGAWEPHNNRKPLNKMTRERERETRAKRLRLWIIVMDCAVWLKEKPWEKNRNKHNFHQSSSPFLVHYLLCVQEKANRLIIKIGLI